MKKNFFVIVLMACFLALNGYVFGQDTVFTSKEGRFNITVPAGFPAFTGEKHTSKTDSGAVEINQFSSDLKRGTLMMAYYDLSDSLFQSKTIQKMLEDGRDGSIKNMEGATILRQENITVDGYAGLSFYVKIPDPNGTIYARSDYVIIKPRVYNYLFLAYDESELYKPDIKKYFSSFGTIK